VLLKQRDKFTFLRLHDDSHVKHVTALSQHKTMKTSDNPEGKSWLKVDERKYKQPTLMTSNVVEATISFQYIA
jgi:hypothetical protein